MRHHTPDLGRTGAALALLALLAWACCGCCTCPAAMPAKAHPAGVGSPPAAVTWNDGCNTWQCNESGLCWVTLLSCTPGVRRQGDGAPPPRGYSGTWWDGCNTWTVQPGGLSFVTSMGCLSVGRQVDGVWALVPR